MGPKKTHTFNDEINENNKYIDYINEEIRKINSDNGY